MKNITVLLLMILLVGCNDELAIDEPQTEKMLVCQCFFQPDRSWEVQLEYTHPIYQSVQKEVEEHATVFIVSENIDTISLYHRANGTYISNEKPIENIAYRVVVVVEQDTITSTESKTPANFEFEVTNFDEDPGDTRIGEFELEDVYRISCNYDGNNDESYLMMRSYNYDSIYHSKLFLICDSVLEKIYNNGLSSSVINKLQHIKGDTIQGVSNFMGTVRELLVDEVVSIDEFIFIEKTAHFGNANKFKLDAAGIMFPVTASQYFHQFAIEFDVLLSQKLDRPIPFDFYLWNFYGGEYWIQPWSISEEAYQYHYSYILQLKNRADNAGLQIPAYSNMSNGVGIFAGVNEQLIKMRDREE